MTNDQIDAVAAFKMRDHVEVNGRTGTVKSRLIAPEIDPRCVPVQFDDAPELVAVPALMLTKLEAR